MEVGLLAVAAAYAAVFVLPWISGPLDLKRYHWSSSDALYVPIDPQPGDVPDQVLETLREVVPRLEELGFTTLGHFGLDGNLPNCTSFVTLFENRRTWQIAKQLTVIGPGATVGKATTVLGFFTEFADGSKLITSNPPTRALEPRLGVRQGSMSFPLVRDPTRLYEIHNASVARYAGDRIRVERAILNPAEFLRTSRREQTAKHIESGHFYLDEEGRRYRPTWKGAILMAWKQRWPIKPIRDWSLQRRAGRMLRELGLDRTKLEVQELDQARFPQ
jgi:hypothetical protein